MSDAGERLILCEMDREQNSVESKEEEHVHYRIDRRRRNGQVGRGKEAEAEEVTAAQDDIALGCLNRT